MQTKKPIGQPLRQANAMANQMTNTDAISESRRAAAGDRVNRTLAALGTISRLKQSSAPTIGTMTDEASATIISRPMSSRLIGTPRASAISGETVASSNGRYKHVKAIRQSTPTATVPTI